jgi:hypothetical protein
MRGDDAVRSSSTPATGSPTRASPATGRLAGWPRPWPRQTSTCRSAARPAAGTPANAPQCAAATLARLGVTHTAHYLIRDGHIGYRSGGINLDGLQHYSPAGSPTPHPA